MLCEHGGNLSKRNICRKKRTILFTLFPSFLFYIIIAFMSNGRFTFGSFLELLRNHQVTTENMIK